MVKMLKIKSKVDLIAEITSEQELIKKLDIQKQYYVVAYLDNALLIGTLCNGLFVFCKAASFKYEYVQRIRIFDAEMELYAWRTSVENGNNTLSGRIRTDGEGDEVYCKEADQLLIGSNPTAYSEGFEELKEDRGFKIIKPITNQNNGSRQAIKTRNYLEVWDNGQLSYDDCRMVEFTHLDGGQENGE